MIEMQWTEAAIYCPVSKQVWCHHPFLNSVILISRLIYRYSCRFQNLPSDRIWFLSVQSCRHPSKIDFHWLLSFFYHSFVFCCSVIFTMFDRVLVDQLTTMFCGMRTTSQLMSSNHSQITYVIRKCTTDTLILMLIYFLLTCQWHGVPLFNSCYWVL